MTAGSDLDPKLMIQPEDIAATVGYVLAMAKTACPVEIRLMPQSSQ